MCAIRGQPNAHVDNSEWAIGGLSLWWQNVRSSACEDAQAPAPYGLFCVRSMAAGSSPGAAHSGGYLKSILDKPWS